MLLDFEELVGYHDMKIHGLVHVGAHLAEEAQEYDKLVKGPVYWIEAEESLLPKIREVLKAYPNQVIIHGLVSDTLDEEVTFNITNFDSMSSSILEFGTHAETYPDIVFLQRRKMYTTTLNFLRSQFDDEVNALVMDIQGAELKALQGATLLLPQIDYVYTEVNREDVYQHCARIEELDYCLKDFERVATAWSDGFRGWGDALYIRRVNV